MKIRLFILWSLLSLCPVMYGQNQAQADLLEKAYRDSSKVLLYRFFDNWAAEVKSNESEAPNKWVAEAHKVFAAFYQPLHLDRIGCDRNEMGLSYKDYPYFIVQDTLRRIYVTTTIPFGKEELEAYCVDRINQMYDNDSIRNVELGYLQKWKENDNLDVNFSSGSRGEYWHTIPMTVVDSNISFRPTVNIREKKIVYISRIYEQLLNAFLGDEHTDLGTHSIMQPAYAEKDSRRRMEFIGQAAIIFYGHWGGYWQYETYPKASSIIFDSNMQRAVVNFRFIYEGGEAFLEKQNGEWTVVSGKLTWIE